MRSRPPTVATWLLEHFRSGSQNDYITGDLIEAYQSGRSRIWYWKEVIVAVVISLFHEIVEHPWFTVRAITIGWAILLFYGDVIGPKVLFPFEKWLFNLSRYTSFTSPWALVRWTVWLAVYVATGWIVARLNRANRTAMVMVFAASVSLPDLRAIPWIWFHSVNTLTNTRFVPYLLNDLANLMLPTVAILFAGLWGAGTENKPEHIEHYSLE